MFRGLFGRGAPQPAPRQAAATAIGGETPLLLTAASFAALTPVAGRLSRVGVYEVPRGEAIALDAARPLRALLKSHVQLTATATAGGEITLDLAAAGISMAESTRAAATLPSASNPNVVVTKAGVKQTIKSVNYATGAVVVQGVTPSVSHTVDVYALAGNGELRLRAIEPAGADQRITELFNETLAALHETDQANGLTAPRLMRGGAARFPLGPKWLLSVEVDSPTLVTLAAESEPVLQLHAYRVPLSVANQAAVNAAVASRLERR